MFAKAQKTSGSAPLKGKDVKKLRRDIATKLNVAEELVQELVPNKASIKKLSFQAPSRTVVYVSDSLNGEPLLFDLSGKGDFVPSVYALWRLQELLPKLYVHAPVSKFVMNGADVMAPGMVFSSQEEFKSLKRGQVRAIYARGNPMPFAVGELMVDAAALERTGGKGRAMQLMHSVGDELWRLGPQTYPNDGFLSDRVRPTEQVDSDSEYEDDDDDTPVGLENVSLEDKPSSNAESTSTTEESNVEEKKMTKQEMDELLERTLLQTIKSNSVKEDSLPMLANMFYANNFLPSRPAGSHVNVKQSSYGKVSAFLKRMEEKGLLKISESDGVQSITAIQRRHPDVSAFEKHKTEGQAQEEAQARENELAGKPAFVPGKHKPEVVEFLGLSPAIKTLLTSDTESAGRFHEVLSRGRKQFAPSQVRDLINEYVELKSLADPQNKKYVLLNGPLTDAVFGKKAPAGGYPDRLPRPDVYSRLMSKCHKYHCIKLYPDHDAKMHGGDFRPISIHVEKSKKHNKSTITTIAGHQQFGIDGTTFAKEVQKKWGCSATTQEPMEKARGTEEIRVQGNMSSEVQSYLGSKYLLNPSKHCSVSFGKGIAKKK